MIKRILAVAAAAALVLTTVVVYRAVTWPSSQPEPAEVFHGEVRDGAIERLAEALRFPTITWTDREFDTAVFDDFLGWLEASYPLTHQRLEVERHGDYSLLITWPGADASLDPVLLMAHYDVVPIEPGTEHEWTYPPFDGTIADGYVWGRGALDDKSGVIGILEAVESLLDEGFEPERTVLLAFGHDEEIGGHDGAARIARHLQQSGVRLHWVLDEGGLVLDDSQFLGGPAASISTAEKGYLSLRLVARAPGGHSSQPPDRTAVGLLAEAVDRIQKQPFPARLQPPTTDMFDVMAGEIDGAMRYLLTNRWLFSGLIKRRAPEDPLFNAIVRTTTAPTMLAAGDKDNVLPQRAEAVINFRLLPGDSVEQVEARIVEIVDDERISVERYGAFGIEASAVSPVDDPFYRSLAATIRGVWPDVVVAPFLLTGATDSRHYAPLTDRIYRFRALRLLQAEIGTVHGTDERVDAQAYLEGIQFYRTVIARETAAF